MHASLYMLEKELIEHKLVTRVPAFVFACLLLVFASFAFQSGENVSYQMQFSGDISQSLSVDVSLLIASASGLLSLLLTALYIPKTLRKERQEGSAMFWRSMPVSFQMTHGVKLAFGLIVIPLICSLLVLAANIMLWTMSAMMDIPLAHMFELGSVVDIVLNWLDYLFRMLLVALAILPLACIALMVSQLVGSPILVMIVASYAIKWLSIYLVGFYGFSQFFDAITSLPMSVFSSHPFSGFINAGVVHLTLYYLCGAIALGLSLRLSRTNEVSLKTLFRG